MQTNYLKSALYLVLSLALHLLLFTSCDPEMNPDPCNDALQELQDFSFRGTILLCNGQPPEMDFLDAGATVNMFNDQIEFHLTSDDSSIDYNLLYDYDCTIVEDTIPLFKLIDSTGRERGAYNLLNNRVSFHFAYPNCEDNTSFQGMAQ